MLTNHYVRSFTFYAIEIIRPTYFILWYCSEISIHLLTHVSSTFFASPNRQVQTYKAKVQWKVPEPREDYLPNHSHHRMLSWNLLCELDGILPTHVTLALLKIEFDSTRKLQNKNIVL